MGCDRADMKPGGNRVANPPAWSGGIQMDSLDDFSSHDNNSSSNQTVTVQARFLALFALKLHYIIDAVSFPRTTLRIAFSPNGIYCYCSVLQLPGQGSILAAAGIIVPVHRTALQIPG